MTEIDKIVMSPEETLVWPEEVQISFYEFVDSAYGSEFRVVCAVGFSLESRRLSVQFSPRASAQVQLSRICQDISDMFASIAKRLKQ